MNAIPKKLALPQGPKDALDYHPLAKISDTEAMKAKFAAMESGGETPKPAAAMTHMTHDSKAASCASSTSKRT